MSKGKRAKSGSAHDINKWENGLVQAVLNEDAWKTCVFFLVSNKLEDNVLVNISSEVISTGLRKLFSVISKQQLYKEVKDYAKALGSSGGKGKAAVKLPEFVEICEQVKPFIDQGEDIPPSLLAKLLKFKLLLLKSKDIERQEETRKEKSKSASGKKGVKRSESPGKRSKSPKKKGKKGEVERPPSPKKDTKLKKRGEVEETFKTIDDEPDDEGSPQHYVLIHGFTAASTLQHLANIGVDVNAIVKLQQDEYKTKSSLNLTEETHEDVEEHENDQEAEVGVKEDDVVDESSRDEEELARFWKESDELVFSAPTGHKLKDIAKYEVTISNTLPVDQNLVDIEPEKKMEFGTAIFDKIANVCYDMLDHQKSYQRFLTAMKLLHVPVHTPSFKTSTQAVLSSAAAVTADPSNQVEIDMRYYNHLLHSIPDESASVPLVLHCILEQVVATVDEMNPLAKQTEVREDGLDNDLAAHINSKMTDLALSSAEKQEILEAGSIKKRRENTSVPEILAHNDNLTQRLHYLEDLSVLDGLNTERSLLRIATPRALHMFPRRTVSEFMESSARFHQFIQHCSFPSAENISYLLKKYAFEGLLLKSVNAIGDVVEPQELTEKFSSYNNPWDDPYSDFSKYCKARDQGLITDDVDLSCVSAAVNLVSFYNVDDWCFIEEFDNTTFTQVLEEARHSHPFVDTYYHKHDDTLLLVYHNPVGEQLNNTSRWNVRLLSNVGFRNYLEHISSMIYDWNLQQERVEEENNKTPTPVPPTPELPMPDIKTGSRYGLKTRAEIAALKAEEEDKGKKKGRRSARSKTPKSGKKSSAGGEKKGSPTKNRTTSASSPGRGTKGSKARLAHETETQPEVVDQGEIDAEEEYAFLGYDVGDDLIHVTGVQSSIFPSDGGEIRVEKTQYVRGSSSVSTCVYKDGNILKLHFLEPLEEILPDEPSTISFEPKDNSESEGKTEDDDVIVDEPSYEGIEKSEFEANEKVASFHQDDIVDSEKIPSQPSPPPICTHASFVGQLNDGMVITCSGFGVNGKPKNLRESMDEDITTGIPLDPSPPPKASSPKSRRKNDEEAKRLEELRIAEEKQRAEEARRLKELQESMKKPFHEIFVSCPDGLHVSYQNDENYISVQDSGGVVVRQRYPFKSRGLHECEAPRGKVAMREISRSIKTNGSVIKIMLDNSIEILHPDGSTNTCLAFPEKREETIERPEVNTQQSNRKGQTKDILMASAHDEPDDQLETTSALSAQWTTVTADGERLIQSLDGNENYVEGVKLSVATCPVTNQIYKTREDNVITVIRPDGTQIVEHADGTRVTTYYDVVKTQIRPADAETGEEAEYESHVCKHVKVECEGFATVVMETEHGSARTLFGNGNSIQTEANGECVIEKNDGSKLCFDIKGNIAYIPQDLSSVSWSFNDSYCTNMRGVYLLRTTSQHCCELLDQQGKVFSAFSNGEIKISESEKDHADILNNEKNETTDDYPSRLLNTAHVPRFFVMRRDGTGYELLRHKDVSEYLKAAECDSSSAVLRTPVEGLPGVTGITVLKPFSGGVGKTWIKEKDEEVLIPVGLRERDFKMFPTNEVKKIEAKFGSNAGLGLNVGNMRKTVPVKPQITCPKVLVLRHLIQYEPTDSTHRQIIAAAFQQYGDYVTKLQLQADGCLPRESRDAEEVERANRLASKYEPVRSKKLQVNKNTNGLCQDYVKSVTPVEQPPPPPPAWKRSPGEWERDRIELAKLNYGKHALRYQEVPPYFDTAQGQAFLNGLKSVPDMNKLSADLDKQACPAARASTDLQYSRSSTISETTDQGNVTTDEIRDQHENLEGKHSPSDPPIQSSTPFASRPINPTPAQAAGRPTPTTTRPTNPTPRQASNLINNEGTDSPRNVQSILEYTPLEAVVETQHEVLTEDNDDTALDLMSSTNSHYNDEGRLKSLYIDVTGSPRKDVVKLPNVILGGKPGALPNTQFSTIEDPVRRKVQTVSVVGKNSPSMRGFELFPPEVDFGILKEGCTYIHSVMLKNIGIDSCRFKIRQPPPSTGLKVLFTPGPVAAGMNTKLDIEVFAIAVGVSGESGIGSIGHHIEIVGETDIIYLPVTATILTAFEYENRSSSLPQGYHSAGTGMISNRPPSREAIRPQRDHIYTNTGKHF